MSKYEEREKTAIVLKERSGSSSSGFLEGSDTNLYPTYYVAISPDGRHVATFNAETLELHVCKVNSLSEKTLIKCDSIDVIANSSSRYVWSLAVSNSIDLTNDEILLAISCFGEGEMMLGKSLTNDSSSIVTYNNRSNENLNETNNEKDRITYEDDTDIEKGDQQVKATTFVISALNNNAENRANSLVSFDDEGGLVRFLNNDPSQPDIITLLIVNVNGISKISVDVKDITHGTSWWSNSSSIQENFFFPQKFHADLRKLYQNTSCLELLSRSIENDYFLIEDYKDRVQVVEMYNLRTTKLDMVFHQRAESAATAFGHGTPAVAISGHKTLLAYCRGANAITIYLMENSLEISTQTFPRFERILSLDFVNNDESLLIIAQERESSIPLIIVWDLFSYMYNAIRIFQDSEKLFSFENYRLVRSFGNIFLVDNSNGNISSILNDKLLSDLLVPKVKSGPLIPLNLPEWYIGNNVESVFHTIFHQNGDEQDAAESKSIIVDDKEPWVHNKKYARISAFLDNEKKSQLIIGKSSIQIWYKKSLYSKEQLKYIRVIPKHEKLSIKSLKIGNREFVVKFSIQSKQFSSGNDEILHWPSQTNAVVDACTSLEHLYDKRDDPAGPQKQQEFENLVQGIEKMIIQFVKKRPSVWRLIDVRYDVMTSLIRGRCTNLIQRILNNQETDSSMRYLHTPRLYSWPKTLRKHSDLEIAIKCIEGRKQRDAVMVGFLLDYYSDNAMDNTGWMFTVSRAVPLLFDYHLDTYVKDLFSKPIFGMKEIHLDESHINPKNLPTNTLKYIKAFNPITKLVPKEEPRKIRVLRSVVKAIKTSKARFTHNHQLAALQKVIPGFGEGDSSALVALKLVPLPDFTVYPEGVKTQELNIRKLPYRLLRIFLWPRRHAITKDEKLSPFLKVVKRDKNGIVFDNPAMEAIIDYKWKSARSHFLRHALLFACYALSFAILTGAVKNSFVQHKSHLDDHAKTVVNNIITGIFYYLGYYLLASEVVQFFHEGWKRYISVYNFFDIASIVMPLATFTVTLIRESNGEVPINQLRQQTIATSFSILILWIEMFLLLRYFAVTGNFIYIVVNIVRNVWPFIAFMAIVVIAHGHAMWLLLRDPESIGVLPDGSQYQMELGGQNITIEQTFDLSNPTDNYFSSIAQSIVAVFFWINGRWDQLQQWNFWPVILLSMIASVLLVIIMQNMLIAFMSGVFDEAKSEGRLAVLKYRAELIADYEILEKPFGDTKGNPRHIFYLGNINKLSKWLRKCEDYWKLRSSSIRETYYDEKIDENEDDNINTSKGTKEWDITGLNADSYEHNSIKLMKRKSINEFYSSWSIYDSIDSVTGETGSIKERRSFNSFNNLSPMIENTNTNTIQDEIASLKGSIKNVKGIDDRLDSLEDKLTKVMNLLNNLADK